MCIQQPYYLVSSRYSSNSIKSGKELKLEIRDFSRFGKKTPSQIHRIKDHAIWINIHKEIEENLDRNIDSNERENTEKL